jgi:UDP-N-acetylmuramyl pentapeptide phosphotransferase/UDP-N-acetylglucosamine-1-phosphate transferase
VAGAPVPVFSVVMGLVLLGAGILGHHAGDGVFALGLMTALGAVFAFGGRSETIRGLRGDGRDERFQAMDSRATPASGGVLLIAVLVAYVVSVANGHSGAPYDWLGAIAGVTYLVSIAWLPIRG